MCRCSSPCGMKSMLAAADFGTSTLLGDGFEPLGLDSTKQIVLAIKDLD